MPARRIFAYVQESPESGCEDIGTIEFGKRWTLVRNVDLAELTDVTNQISGAIAKLSEAKINGNHTDVNYEINNLCSNLSRLRNALKALEYDSGF